MGKGIIQSVGNKLPLFTKFNTCKLLTARYCNRLSFMFYKIFKSLWGWRQQNETINTLPTRVSFKLFFYIAYIINYETQISVANSNLRSSNKIQEKFAITVRCSTFLSVRYTLAWAEGLTDIFMVCWNFPYRHVEKLPPGFFNTIFIPPFYCETPKK